MFVFQMPAAFIKIQGLNRVQIDYSTTEYSTTIVLTLHCRNILTIFKQLHVLSFLLADFTARFTRFQFQKNGEYTI